MQYANGLSVELGDRVRLGQDSQGVVVCLIDRSQYTEKYPKSDWEHLKRGVMIDFPIHGLIHYMVVEPSIELVGRNS